MSTVCPKDLNSATLVNYLSSPLSSWVGVMGSGNSGPNLQYDPRFMALFVAAEGKPETSFSDAEPPNWIKILDDAEALLTETRDLRLLTLWAHAHVKTNGFNVVPDVLWVIASWLSGQWETLNPPLDEDDQDPFERINALLQFSKEGPLFQVIGHAELARDPLTGSISIKKIENALQNSFSDETASVVPTKTQIEQFFRSSPARALTVHEKLSGSIKALDALVDALKKHVDEFQCPEFSDLRKRFESALRLTQVNTSVDSKNTYEEIDGGANQVDDSGPVNNMTSKNLPGSIASRQQAIEAIDQVCEYLERTEPSNPAQLLLKRAKRSLNKDFLDLVQDIAPDAVNDVAKILGIDLNERYGSDY